jgi:2-methylisocitrate lyase-like PEP mutase family enzyme
MTTQLEKCHQFKALHTQSEAWVIPNPWDAGSAKLLAGLGFKALATTSGGFAFTQGKLDGDVGLEATLQHCAALSAATEVPISVDFEDGYAEDLDTMAANMRRLIATGVAGFSIEDFNRERRELYSVAEATARIRVAVATIAESGIPLMLTARAEGLLRAGSDREEVTERMLAYSAAGADVLFAPAVNSLEQLEAITSRLDKPFNVLASFIHEASLKELAAAGAQRVSVGGALTWTCLNPLLSASREMLEQGTFSWIGRVAAAKEFRSLMGLA